MALKEKIKKLATVTAEPCVSISLNTHRTRPASDKDKILLKNLLSQAEKQIVAEYGKRTVTPLLEKIATVENRVNENNNLDSLHVFLSNDTEEIIRTSWTVPEDRLNIRSTFNLRPLIKAYNRSKEYLILVLSQGGVQLYKALGDGIEEEVKSDGFPFEGSPYYIPNRAERSNAKRVDDLIREFFNQVDKAVVKVNQETELECVVVSTEDNFSKLMQVADKPDIYIGYTSIDYNNSKPHDVVKPGWEIMKQYMHEHRSEAIVEMKEAISKHKVLTDLQEIYRAAIDGNGEMLIVYDKFSQPVRMIDERNFELLKEANQPDVIDDIVSDIAWQVVSKGGKVFFTMQDEIKELDKIALKTRY